jgi:hypothetical protein
MSTTHDVLDRLKRAWVDTIDEHEFTFPASRNPLL